MLAMARAQDQPHNECAALNRLAMVAIHRYEFERAVSLLQEAVQIAGASGDNYGLAQSEWGLAQLGHHQFDFEASLIHSQRSLAAARELGDRELVASALNALGYAHLLLGSIEAAKAAFREARGLFASLQNQALEADCLTALACAELWLGKWSIWIELAREAVAISQKIDNPWGKVYSYTWLAAGLLDGGAYEEAFDAANAGREVAAANDFMPVTLLNLLVMGGIYRSIGRIDLALEAHLEASTSQGPYAELFAAELCADNMLLNNPAEAYGYACRAIEQRTYKALPLILSPHWLETEALLLGGNWELARRDITRWGELTRLVPRFRLAFLRSLALLDQREGDTTGAMAALEEALALATEMDLPDQRWQVLTDLGELLESIGAGRPAREQFIQAVELLETIAGKIRNEDFKTGFLSAQASQRVLKKAV
jgi:tetratricopeptide (TPR) repeat protein